MSALNVAELHVSLCTSAAALLIGRGCAGCFSMFDNHFVTPTFSRAQLPAASSTVRIWAPCLGFYCGT